MESLLKAVTTVSNWLWGPPLIALLTFCGIFLTIRLGFFQFRYAGYIFKQTIGKTFKKQSKGDGTVSAFQSFASAVACTVGAGNIVGVPAAIMFGGPGAVLWMWFIALIGMAMKFTEVVLAVHYREKNEAGEYVGGPMYYMTKGLNMKWLGIWFAIGLMFEVAPSTMIQANSVVSSAEQVFHINPVIGGIITLIVVGSVVIGGIKRIGKVSELLVPFMALLYVGAAVIIVILNITELPGVIKLIFVSAFNPSAAVGGAAGAAIATAIRWGFARGLYSNESGLGTAPIAHATAITDHPVRQGLWSTMEVFLDTIVICSATAFSVLITGVWKNPGAMENPSALTATAFTQSLGPIGGMIVTISLLLFVITTIIVLIWYGEKQAEFLFGLKGAKLVKYIYVICIYVGAVGGAKIMWNFLDITLAAIAIPNMIAILLLSGKVKELKNEFFTSDKYYLKDINNVK